MKASEMANEEPANLFEAAHQREVAELKRQRKEALAIAYAELLVKNTKRNYDIFGGITHHTDMMTARNVLHTLKGEPKEGGVAVCD